MVEAHPGSFGACWKEIAQSMFEGHENSKVVRHDLLALQVF